MLSPGHDRKRSAVLPQIVNGNMLNDVFCGHAEAPSVAVGGIALPLWRIFRYTIWKKNTARCMVLETRQN
jgi:hypothetical protein